MRRKPFHVFLLHAGFLLALFGALGGTNEFYARGFHRVGNALLSDFGGGLSLHFQWADAHKRRDSADTRMIGRRTGDLEYAWRAIYSARRRGFWPSATLLALTLALPMPRPRRALAVVVGLVAFNAFFVAEVAALAALFFRASGAVPGVAPDTWRHVIPLAEALFNTPITNFSVVFLLWAGLTQPARGIEFGTVLGGLRRILGSESRETPPPGNGPSPPADG